MGAQRIIDTVVILDRDSGQIGQCLTELRPDLKVYDDVLEISALDAEKYAIITFDPGKRINDFPTPAWIHCSGAGVDFLLAALDQPVPVITRTTGNMGRQIAEYVLAYVLGFSQKIAERKVLQAAFKWDQAAASPQYLAGKKALVFGTGAIGCAIARSLTGFSVRCTGVSRSGQQKKPFETVLTVADLTSARLAEQAVIVLALPNHPATRSMINNQVLQHLDGALLINIGRSQALVVDDLLAAMDQGQIAQAVLDVFDSEPLASDSPLWRHPKVQITPHVAGLTRPVDAAQAFVAALQRLEAGEQPELYVSQQRGY